MKIALAALLSLALVGCSVPQSIAEGGTVSGQVVTVGAKVLVLGVTDGQEAGQPPAVGSEHAMATAVRNALMAHGVPISTTETSALTAGYEEAARGGFAYVMKTSITLWEDNATAWSGNGDKLSISIELYDVKTHMLVAAASHHRIATGATFMSGSPDRFMDECAQGALGKIFGWPPAKS